MVDLISEKLDLAVDLAAEDGAGIPVDNDGVRDGDVFLGGATGVEVAFGGEGLLRATGPLPPASGEGERRAGDAERRAENEDEDSPLLVVDSKVDEDAKFEFVVLPSRTFGAKRLAFFSGISDLV